jgi:hypothetical protein
MPFAIGMLERRLRTRPPPPSRAVLIQPSNNSSNILLWYVVWPELVLMRVWTTSGSAAANGSSAECLIWRYVVQEWK